MDLEAESPGSDGHGTAVVERRSTDDSRSISHWTTAVAAIGLPLVLYAILRPENYALTPNSLDPFFYTGYAINFDDVLNATSDRYYFVSRWSAYLPAYVSDRLFGPFAGRLLWRLALASGLLLSIWALGKRWTWSRSQQLLIGTVVLSTPMFVRAFFSDYVEYLVVALGVSMVCLCLRDQQKWWSALAIGMMAGLIVVANPISVTLVGFSVIAAATVGVRGVRGRLWLAALIGGGASFVVVSGLFLFRWRYGIDNVYQPSIDFFRNYSAPAVDPWKSPRSEWLEKYTWLYAPPALLLTAGVLSWRRIVTFDRIGIAALVLCGVQYVYQWFDQFVRGGFGLELSFYWSFSLPTFLVALAVVVGHLSTSLGPIRSGAIGSCWVLLLIIGVPEGLRLPGGIWFGILAIAVIVAVAAIARRSMSLGLSALLALIVWTQVGAPRYDPSAYFLLNSSPNYDQLFRKAGSASETIYHEAVWFERQMDLIANDASTSFVPMGGWSSSIAGLYSPHVVGRIITVDESNRLTNETRAQIKSGSRPLLAVYGPPENVRSLIDTFPEDLGVGKKLLDVTHDSALGYRLVVYSMPENQSLPFTWSADSLPNRVGQVVDDEVVVRAGDEAGIVTFGPYIVLPAGDYRVEFTYRSSLDPSEVAGTVDVSSLETGTVATAEIRGTGGDARSRSLSFTVPDDRGPVRWEFRISWSGSGSFVVDSVTLSAG